MAEKLRLFAIVIVFLVFGAILYTALSGSNDVPEFDVTSVPDVERREGEVPRFDFDSTSPSRPVDKDDGAESDATRSTRQSRDKAGDDASQQSGKGKITVNLEMDGGLGVPSNLEVTLHYIPDEARFDSTADTVFAVKNPDADDKAVFEDLPMGYYVVFAQSATHTGTSNRSLAPEYMEREVNVTLFPAGQISGTVVNTSGEPVTDAKVFVAGYLTGGRDTDAGLYRSRASGVAVDQNGAYTMNNLQIRVPALQYRLMAMAPDYAPTVTELFPLGSSGVEIVLGAGGMVAGHVVNDETGEPVPNAKLGAMPMHDLAKKETQTDAEGAFEFSSLSAGDYTFQVESEELVVKGDSLKLTVTDGLDVDDLRIAVMTGGIATGRVFDADTGAGVADAQIYGDPNGIDGASTKEATTDSNGEYRLVGLHAGAYRIQYRQIDGYPEQDYNDRKEIMINLGQVIRDLDFALVSGLSISGYIVTEEGKRVEAGYVYGSANNSRRRDNTNLKEDGTFAIYGFEPNDLVNFQITPTGFGRIYEKVQLEETSITGVRFVAEAEAKISGIVVNEAGTPLSSVSIYARNESDNIMGGGENSDTKGEFELTQLSSGKYTLHRSFGNSYSSADTVLERVTLSKGEHLKDVRVVVKEDDMNNMEISGIVSDDTGTPVGDVQVNSWSGRSNAYARTGNDGRYTLSELPKGEIQVQFQHETHVPQNQTFQSGVNNANVTMPRMGSVSGEVVDASSGTPVKGFALKIVPGNRAPVRQVTDFKLFHDDGGEFTLQGTYPNMENTLMARAEGYAETSVPIQGALSGQTVSGITVRLQDEAKVTGIVVDDSGSPVSAAWIYRGSVPQNEWERDREKIETTGPDGRFEVGGLGTGDMTFSAFKNGFAPATVSLYVGGTNNEIEFVLSEGATVEGMVTLQGRPMTEGQVYGYIFIPEGNRRSQFEFRANLDSEGRYHASGLPDGNGSVSASIRDNGEQRSKRVDIETASGLVTEANFDFENATSVVEGYIFISETETGAGNVSLELIDSSGGQESRWKEVGADGYFLFEQLPSGNVALRVYDQHSRKQKRATGTVGDNERLRLDIHMYGGGDVNVSVSNVPDGHNVFAALVQPDFPIPSTPNEQLFRDMNPYTESQTQILNGAGTILGAAAGNYNLVVIHYTVIEGSGVDYSTAGITSTPVTVTDGEQVSATVSF